MRILIFGATGLLGKALRNEWRDDPQVVGLGSSDVDIRSKAAVQRVIQRHEPEWIVLAAAYTDVDGCETHRDLAFAVNCTGALNVIEAACAAGSCVVFLSTDYVFDGSKRTPYETTDPRGPRTVYGQSKAAAEERILALTPDCCIVRTSWVFGTGGKCFPDTILKLAATKQELDVVDDQRGCPTYTVDLAHAIRQLIQKEARGIVHCTNRGDCTWFEFAQGIVHGADLATVVNATTSEKFPRPAERPQYSVLSASSLTRVGVQMPTWQDALRRYLAERAASS